MNFHINCSVDINFFVVQTGYRQGKSKVSH